MQGGVRAALTAEFCRRVMCLNAAFVLLDIIIGEGCRQTQLLDVKCRCPETRFVFSRPLLLLLRF